MEDIVSGFKSIYDYAPEAVCFAPGRINLIGEHTDYNGGLVLPCAIQLGIQCAGARNRDKKLRFYSTGYPEEGIIDYPLHSPELRGCWADYPVSVVRAAASFGYSLDSGADFYISCDLPEGAGLSSSAALEAATGVMLRTLFSFPLTQQVLALLGQFAENRFIGVNCGIMDQFVCAMGKAGHALLLDTNTLSFNTVPLGNAAPVIVNSGVKHSLAASAYNDRRRECETARGYLSVPSLCSLTPEELEKRLHMIPDEICRKRARHAVYESERARLGAEALYRGDLHSFGQLMNLSHASLRNDFEVSCEELDFLAETAQGLPGVYGSRMTGGGFGGCTVSLLEPEEVDNFVSAIRKAYFSRYGKEPDVYPVSAVDGAVSTFP